MSSSAAKITRTIKSNPVAPITEHMQSPKELQIRPIIDSGAPAIPNPFRRPTSKVVVIIDNLL